MLVIATIIVTGAYVGYHVWEESLHEEAEKHSESIELEKHQKEFNPVLFQIKTNLIGLNS